ALSHLRHTHRIDGGAARPRGRAHLECDTGDRCADRPERMGRHELPDLRRNTPSCSEWFLPQARDVVCVPTPTPCRRHWCLLTVRRPSWTSHCATWPRPG